MTDKKSHEKEVAVAVKKIVVQIGKKEIILAIDDALELQKALNELFSSAVVPQPETITKEIVKEHHHHHDRYWGWNQPFWYGGNGYKYVNDGGIVYCSSNQLDMQLSGSAASSGIVFNGYVGTNTASSIPLEALELREVK